MYNLNQTELDKSSSENNLNLSWVPPNDRELIIRAKLKTGWSTRSSSSKSRNNSTSNSSTNTEPMLHQKPNSQTNLNSSQHQPLISESEFIEIEHVIARANQIEKKESARISRLFNRYKTINKPLGNGETNCIICNTSFGLITSYNAPRICNHCYKNVCNICSVDGSSNKQNPVWLCTICAEYREYLKKSGAWFNKKVPIELENNNYIDVDIGLSPSTTLLLNQNKTNNNTNDSTKHSNIASSPSVNNCSLRSNEAIEENNKHQVSDNSINNSKSEDSETSDHTKYYSTKSIQRDNSEMKLLDPEQESKLLQEQIAASKHINLNSFNISSITTLNTNTNNNNNNNNNNNDNSEKRLIKTSTLTSDSMQNLSLAFKQYKNENAQLGYLQFNVEYIPSLLQLKIYLVSASNLPARDSNGLSDPYVKIHLLPGVAKATKLRSKTIYKNLNPSFNEEFHYDGVSTQDLDTKTLRLTVLDEDKFGFDFIGEYRLPLKTLIPNEINYFSVALEEKQELGDEADSSFRGKINFALKYSKKTNCLYVKINRCTQLMPMDNGKSSDPFVEVALLPGSKDFKHNKFRTSTKWKTLDPEFSEEFKFTNIDLRTLLTKNIEISVWDKDFTKNDFIGVVQLGQQRSGDELKHFFTVVKNPEIYHENWHTLHFKDNDLTNEY